MFGHAPASYSVLSPKVVPAEWGAPQLPPSSLSTPGWGGSPLPPSGWGAVVPGVGRGGPHPCWERLSTHRASQHPQSAPPSTHEGGCAHGGWVSACARGLARVCTRGGGCAHALVSTCTCVHTRLSVHLPACMYAGVGVHVCVHLHACAYAFTPMRVHLHAYPTHTRACVLFCPCACMPGCACAWACVGVHGCAWVCMGVRGRAWACVGAPGWKPLQTTRVMVGTCGLCSLSRLPRSKIKHTCPPPPRMHPPLNERPGITPEWGLVAGGAQS